MSNIDKRALREAAERAGADEWCVFIDTKSKTYSVHTPGDNRCGDVVKWAGFDGQQRAAAKAKFIASANPATVLALLDELEAKDNRINRLEAIVAVAEQRNALMREWKRALKVPCDLVDDQVPVVIHGMVIRLERLKETEEKLSAAAGKGE